MSRKEQVSYKDGSVTFEKTSFKDNNRVTILQSGKTVDHTKSDYEKDVLVLKYVLSGVTYADEKEALKHLVEKHDMSPEFASRYLSILPHLL